MPNAIFLNMVNLDETQTDAINRVNAELDPTWANPYNKAKSFTEQVSNYRKYKFYLPNNLFIENDVYVEGINSIVERAKETGKIVFECTCFPGPCHLDVVREIVTERLEAEGYKVHTNADVEKLAELCIRQNEKE